MRTSSKSAALLCTTMIISTSLNAELLSAGTVPGWPDYIAMGAVGGPNITPPTATSTGGDDDLGAGRSMSSSNMRG
jgi:hypothetical protein